MAPRRYSDEEAREILERAMDSDQAMESGLTQQDLVEAAAEVGISSESMARAAEELRVEGLAKERLEERKLGRRRRWWGSLATFAAVNSFLFVLDAMTAGGPWWQWPVIGWGFFVMLGGLRAYLPKGEDHQRRAVNKEVDRVRQAEAREAKRRAKAARRRERKGLGAELEGAIDDGVSAVLAAAVRGVTAATEALVGEARTEPGPARHHGGPQVHVGPASGPADAGTTGVAESEVQDSPAASRHRQPGD